MTRPAVDRSNNRTEPTLPFVWDTGQIAGCCDAGLGPSYRRFPASRSVSLAAALAQIFRLRLDSNS